MVLVNVVTSTAEGLSNYIIRQVYSRLMFVIDDIAHLWDRDMRNGELEGGGGGLVWNVCRWRRCDSLDVNSSNLPSCCWCFVLSYIRNAFFQLLVTGNDHTLEFWHSTPCSVLLYFDSSVLEAHNLCLFRRQEILSWHGLLCTFRHNSLNRKNVCTGLVKPTLHNISTQKILIQTIGIGIHCT
jgi:hypothetical protein